jgi:predicted HTH transcriptional regulator
VDQPQFVVKAIRYPGKTIHVSEYVDTEDFSGPLRKVFDDSLGFIMRNLHKVQAGRGVNAPGVPEISETVFEELLVNALVHRDYLVSAPIRIFIFDDRIEIISPGHLPNNLTVEKIRRGNSIIRNPILVSYVAKGLLPYHGLGSGIKRALEQWPQIDSIDDREGCLFIATVHRLEEVQKQPPRTTQSPTQLTDPVDRLIQALGGNELSSSELREALNLKHRHTFRQNYLHPALERGVIEHTIPEKPNSRNQKYRLTLAGRTLLAGFGGTENE